MVDWIARLFRLWSRQAERAFFAELFRVMGWMSKADGRVSEAEIRAARRAMRRLGLDAASERRAQEWFREGKAPGFDGAAAAARLARICRGRATRGRFALELLVSVAHADGAQRPQSERRLLDLAAGLGVTRAEFEHIAAPWRINRPRAAAAGPLAQAYGELGLGADAAPLEITRAYRRLLRAHHPDKQADRGDAAQREAAARTHRIVQAYERIRAARGF